MHNSDNHGYAVALFKEVLMLSPKQGHFPQLHAVS